MIKFEMTNTNLMNTYEGIQYRMINYNQTNHDNPKKYIGYLYDYEHKYLNSGYNYETAMTIKLNKV